jgi:hypothetical protein
MSTQPFLTSDNLVIRQLQGQISNNICEFNFILGWIQHFQGVLLLTLQNYTYPE